MTFHRIRFKIHFVHPLSARHRPRITARPSFSPLNLKRRTPHFEPVPSNVKPRTSHTYVRLLATMSGILGLVLPILSQGHAAEPSPLEQSPLLLRDVLQYARAHNPELQATQFEHDAAKERISQARALEDPEIKIQLWNTPESFNLTRTQRTIYGFAQSFPFPGTLALRETVARHQADRAASRRTAQERRLIADVKIAYYDLFWSHKALQIHHEQIDLLRQFFDIANAKFRVGEGSQVDVLKAQVELSTLMQRLPVLDQRRKTAGARLNTLLHRDPTSPLGSPSEPQPEPLFLSREYLGRLALALRPELHESRDTIRHHQSAVRLAELRFYPGIRIEGQRWQNYQTNDGYGANFTLNIPFAFWTKSKYDAGVREAEARLRQAKARHRALEDQTTYRVEDLYTQIQATHQVVELYRTTVLPQAEQALEATQAGYRTDRADFLDLIDAERALLEYRLEYAHSLVTLEQQRAALEQVIGQSL